MMLRRMTKACLELVAEIIIDDLLPTITQKIENGPRVG